MGHKLYCSLMVDEMGFKKNISWNGHKFVGYVDIGTCLESDSLPLAREAWVFPIVALNRSWKLPCAYFFIDGLNGEERARLVSECLSRLYEVGMNVVSLTFDGTSTNFSMANCLGACLEPFNLKTSFPHRSTQEPVYVILDPCHMIKLIRNTLGDKKVLKDSQGKDIRWRYICELHELQYATGLKAANKLSLSHISWQKQKMKVSLATQTLSSSVADAVEFCNINLSLPKFRGSEPTVKFIRIIDRLFDLMNSSNPFAKNYKAPLRLSNEWFWKSFASEAETYLYSLVDPLTKKLLIEGTRKTAVLGFIINLRSFSSLYSRLVAAPDAPLKYLLTYKFNQDHLELLFNSVRQMGGWCNNPTVVQFEAAYKRLLIHNQVKSASTGNCQALDRTDLLFSSEAFAMDINCKRRYEFATEFVEKELKENEAVVLPTDMTLNLYSESVVEYIAGYVVRNLSRHVKFPACLDALKQDCSNFPLVLYKDRGGLFHPAEDVVVICKSAEKVIKSLLPKETPLSRSNLLISLVIKTMNMLKTRDLFPQLKEHAFDSPVSENHTVCLLKQVAETYIKIRLHSMGKSFTKLVIGENVRSRLTKTILFKNQ